MTASRRALVGALLAVASPALADEKKADAGDWRPLGEVVSHDRKSLYQAINGAADLFIGYGFRSLREQTYARGARQVTVQIYEQGSLLDAFGVFTRERPPGGKEVGAGAGSAAGKDGECLAFKGSRYVKVLSLKARLDADACRGILSAVVRRLPGDNQRPPELSLLPASRQVAGTLGYTRGSFLGTRQLTDCVHADYTSASGARYTLFALVLSATRTADAVWRGLAGAWKLERLGKTELVSWRHPYRGMLGIIRRKGAIVGAVGVGDGKATAALLEGL